MVEHPGWEKLLRAGSRCLDRSSWCPLCLLCIPGMREHNPELVSSKPKGAEPQPWENMLFLSWSISSERSRVELLWEGWVRLLLLFLVNI